ncbi:MAG: serine protease [Pseudomonadota bacterium]
MILTKTSVYLLFIAFLFISTNIYSKYISLNFINNNQSQMFGINQQDHFPELYFHSFAVGYIERLGNFIGTAFLISNDGLMLTSAHVIIKACYLDNCNESRVILKNYLGINQYYNFNIISKNLDLDYAIIKIKGDYLDLPEPLELYNTYDILAQESEVFLLSFYFNKNTEEIYLIYSHGYLNDSSSIEDLKYKPSYSYSANTLPGFSGAPVLCKINEEYIVIAIHWGSDESANLGIPIFLIDFN